jgi:cytoskeletal protein CcmA (bactofilin family)
MTRIPPSLLISGEIESAEELIIEGHVLGYVLMRNAPLTIAEDGQVDAEVRGVRVLVHGRLTGSITATERIEVGPQAAVRASLSASQVVLADGARFDGGIDMQQRTIAVRMAQHRATSTPHPESPAAFNGV